MAQRTYLAIDLKSYYASAECAARHLDPLTTNLVVADASRTEKTICLAVSPSLKSYGIPGRARLFEVVQRVKEINNGRLRDAIRNKTAVYKDGVPSLAAASYDATALAADSSLEVSYLVAPPRMAYYEKISRQIYGIYLKYIAPEDIVVYRIPLRCRHTVGFFQKQSLIHSLSSGLSLSSCFHVSSRALTAEISFSCVMSFCSRATITSSSTVSLVIMWCMVTTCVWPCRQRRALVCW